MKKKRHQGGWPLGVRRNPDCGRWDYILARLRRLLYSVDQAAAKRTGISQRGLARHLGVDCHAVGNWLLRIDRPPVETQLRVNRWVIAHS